MEEIIKHLIEVEKKIAKEKGDFKLFGLFLKEDAEGKWDLVVSASWAQENGRKSLAYIIREIQGKLKKEDLLKFSSVQVLEPEHPFVKVVNRAISTKHSSIELKHCYFNNILIKHSFIITSQKKEQELAKK